MAAWLCSNGAKAKAKANLVRIVHPGGHVEVHDGPVRAAEIMLRNPKFRVTHSSQPSRQPWAIVSPETTLMAGRKYYLFPESTVGKLQRRRPATAKGNGDSDCGNCVMCSVEEGIKSGERIIMKRRGVFLQNGKVRGSPKKQFGCDDHWEPSLNSITEEVS